MKMKLINLESCKNIKVFKKHNKTISKIINKIKTKNLNIHNHNC